MLNLSVIYRRIIIEFGIHKYTCKIHIKKGKGKGVTLAMRATRAVDLQLYYCLIWTLDRGGWVTPRPGRFTPGDVAVEAS